MTLGAIIVRIWVTAQPSELRRKGEGMSVGRRAVKAAGLSMAVVLAAGLFQGATPAPPSNGMSGLALTAAAATWEPAEGPVFNHPRSFDSRQWRIEAHVLAAIRHARKGSYIHMSMYSFDRQAVADALIEAYRRGVHVQVLLNNHEHPRPQGDMKRVIGTNRGTKSFVYSCKRTLDAPKSEGSCRGAGDVLHSKFILFSRTGAAKNTVMLGSVNMKLNGHRNQYNDLYTRSHVPGIRSFFLDIFREMKRDRAVSKPYRYKSWPTRWRVEFFPYKGRARNDPQMMALKPVKCKRSSITNEGGRTEVRVNMHAWHTDRGIRIAKRLRKLYAEGCDVKIHYGMAGRKVRQVLANPTHRGRVPVRSSGFDTTGDGVIDLYSHQKMLSIKGGYFDKRGYRGVWTGSPNYSTQGKYGDEVLFRINIKGNQNRYTRNWRWMWENKTRKLRSSSATASFNIFSGEVELEPPMLIDPLSDNSIHLIAEEG